MRIAIRETKVYKYAELSDEAQQKVMEILGNTNVDNDWWNCIYDDAAAVGIKITGFDLSEHSCSYCHGEFTDDAENIAEKISATHGETCETYKTASKFIKAHNELINEYSDGMDELRNEFYHSILEDYRIMLQKDYEYLISEKAILETIDANDYEFTEDGNLY